MTADWLRLGKKRSGTIRVTEAYAGKQVVIEIGYDGAGIPVAKVAAKAIAMGLITIESVARMTENGGRDHFRHIHSRR